LVAVRSDWCWRRPFPDTCAAVDLHTAATGFEELRVRSVVKNRLLFVCPTSSPTGGIQTWLDELCGGLESRGWEPVVALVHGPNTNDAYGYRAAHPRLTRTLVVDGTGMSMASRVRAVMRLIERQRPEFYVPLTVIDAHDAVCELRRRGRFAGRYVLSLHGNLPEQIADAARFQSFADVSLNPGALTCRLAAAVGMPDDRIRHIPHGATQHALRDLGQAADGPLRLAYVGRLSQADKRVMDLVPLVRELEGRGVDYSLDVVGDGPCLDDLRTGVDSPRVTFHGFVDPERLAREFYPTWDALLLFSQSEAFGLSLVEAMSHGVVPVSSRFVGQSSEGFLVDGETARLFDIGDMVGCAVALAALHSDREALVAMARRGHELVRVRYVWTDCVDAWHEALTAARDLEPRQVPTTRPRPFDEGGGSLAALGFLPGAVLDAIRSARRRLQGVPAAMLGGEEWPLSTGLAAPEVLERIEAASMALDRGEEGGAVAPLAL
jgi:glycosyltransferase involved in cell wall biosynthesis